MPKADGTPAAFRAVWSVATSFKEDSSAPVITSPKIKRTWEDIPSTAIAEKNFLGSRQQLKAKIQERAAVTLCLKGSRKGSCSMTILTKTNAPPVRSKNMHPAKSNRPILPKAA